MKRCPQCNRVENDDALAFCRTDGAPLVIESGSISAEAGTIKLGSGLVSTDVATSILPIQTDAEIARSTGPTTVLPTTTTPSSTRELTTAKRRGIVFGLIALAVLLVALAAYFYFSRRSTPAIQSIAVMPFLNESGNMDVEYLSDGMTETLISSLSQIPNLNVKARSTVFRYKGKVTDVKTIGKELGVQAVLNGHVVQRGNRLTLSLELTDTQTENVIWSDKYDRDQADLINLQNEIARDVSSRLKLKLTGADQQKLVRNYTLDPEVYKLYLQGRFYWNKSSISEVAKAETYFKQAVDRDPNFALGLVGLADCFQDVDRPRKKEYIRRALDIDDNLAEAHASLGYQLMCDREWLASERELKRAMTLNPNYAQSYAWNGGRLMMIGNMTKRLLPFSGDWISSQRRTTSISKKGYVSQSRVGGTKQFSSSRDFRRWTRHLSGRIASLGDFTSGWETTRRRLKNVLRVPNSQADRNRHRCYVRASQKADIRVS